MLLPSLSSVVHVVVTQRIFHELPCLFHHTVMSLTFLDIQIWANIVNPNQTAPDQGGFTMFVIPYASFERISV